MKKELKECPECKSELIKKPIAKLKGNTIQVIGCRQVCTRIDCTFEIDLT